MSPAQSHHPEGLMLLFNLDLALPRAEEADNSHDVSVPEGKKEESSQKQPQLSICLICVGAFIIFS